MSRRSRRDPSPQPNEENHHVPKVIKYLLATDRLKTPISGEQIKKICFSDGGSYAATMTLVKRNLIDLFGYELIDLGRMKYILVNKINNPHLTASSDKEEAEQILLFLTLTYIFMSCDNDNEFVKEDDLWSFFSGLKIVKEDNFQHNYFGDVQKLITSQFVEQLYLNRFKIDDTEDFGYVWGARANAEMNRRSILEFVSKIYNGRSIDKWPAQAAAMRESEKSGI